MKTKMKTRSEKLVETHEGNDDLDVSFQFYIDGKVAW